MDEDVNLTMFLSQRREEEGEEMNDVLVIPRT